MNVDTRSEPGESAPIWLWNGRIPGLDGLRALSVCGVLLAHTDYLAAHSPWLRSRLEALGSLSVTVFFVISGFLISLLLIREKDRTGRISLPAFYRRRSLRILPAYVSYLLVIFSFQCMQKVSVPRLDWAAAVTYTTNFFHHRSFAVGHLWSLSVEEHFYLLWPLAFMLAPRRRLMILCAALIAITPFIRFLLSVHGNYSTAVWLIDADYSSFTRMDALACGCLLAFLAHNSRWRQWMAETRRYMMPVVLAILAFPLIKQITFYRDSLQGTVNAVLIAAFIWIVVTNTRWPLTRFLSGRLMVSLGILSYSIYLWHPLVFHFLPAGLAWIFPGIMVSILVAWLSYQLVERPFLLLKDGRRPGSAR